MKKNSFIPLDFKSYPPEEMWQRARDYRQLMSRRRSVRAFSDKAVPRSLIETLLLTAGSAPSGANLQPWHFVAVSDPGVKKKIRLAAEEEERAFYSERAPEEWLKDLEPFATNDQKPFLETAPWLIAVFEQRYGINADGSKKKHYYVGESVGLATGLLISAIHNAGLACLTHTPSPMKFLNDILERPVNEKPFLLLVVGYPEKGITVPDNRRKGLDEIATFI